MCRTSLSDAMTIVAEEQNRVSAEQKGFKQFVNRVAEIDTQSGEQRTQMTRPLSPTTTDSKPTPSQQVYEIYRNTVMAIPHYEEDYGEPVAVHLRMELGDEISTALTANQSTTPQLKQALLQTGKRERDKRDMLEQDLKTESKELKKTEKRIDSIQQEVTKRQYFPSSEQTFDDLQQWVEQLTKYDQRLDRFIQQRQQNLRMISRKRQTGEKHAFQAYLYDELAVQYPILAALMTTTEKVRHARHEVEDHLQALITDSM